MSQVIFEERLRAHFVMQHVNLLITLATQMNSRDLYTIDFLACNVTIHSMYFNCQRREMHVETQTR